MASVGVSTENGFTATGMSTNPSYKNYLNIGVNVQNSNLGLGINIENIQQTTNTFYGPSVTGSETQISGDLIVKSFGSKLNRNSVGVSPNSGDIKVVKQSGKDSRQFVGINFGGALKFIFGIEVNLKLGVKF